MEEEFNYFERYQKRIEEKKTLEEQKSLPEKEIIVSPKIKKKAMLHNMLRIIGLSGLAVAIAGAFLDNLLMQIVGGAVAGCFLGAFVISVIIRFYKKEKDRIEDGKLLTVYKPVIEILMGFAVLVMIGGLVMMSIGIKEVFYWGVGAVCGSLGMFLLMAIIPILFAGPYTGRRFKNKAHFEEEAIENEASVIFIKRAKARTKDGKIYNYVGLEFDDGKSVTLSVEGRSFKKGARLIIKYLADEYRRCVLVDCEQNRRQEMPAEYQW